MSNNRSRQSLLIDIGKDCFFAGNLVQYRNSVTVEGLNSYGAHWNKVTGCKGGTEMFGNFNIGIMGSGNIAGIMAGTINKMKNVRVYAVASRQQVHADVLQGNMAVRRLMDPMPIWWQIKR